MCKVDKAYRNDVGKEAKLTHLPEMKIDWQGFLYIKRGNELVKLECKYSNAQLVKYCTHNCALFHEPEPVFCKMDMDDVYKGMQLPLCETTYLFDKLEFVDERIKENE